MTATIDRTVTALCTLQFGGTLWSALTDTDTSQIEVHLVRSTAGGTPGPTLCGVDRFAPDAPGWTFGGISGPGYLHVPCLGCLAAAHTQFHGLKIHGLGVDAFRVLQVPALSIRPPWAQLIMGGYKPCENRTQATRYRGPVIIHAGQTWDQRGVDVAADELVWIDKSTASSRGYLGVVDLVDDHPAAECGGVCGPWGEPGTGIYHRVALNPRLFAEPIPGPGSLGLYRKTIPVAALTAAQELIPA